MELGLRSCPEDPCGQPGAQCYHQMLSESPFSRWFLWKWGRKLRIVGGEDQLETREIEKVCPSENWLCTLGKSTWLSRIRILRVYICVYIYIILYGWPISRKIVAICGASDYLSDVLLWHVVSLCDHLRYCLRELLARSFLAMVWKLCKDSAVRHLDQQSRPIGPLKMNKSTAGSFVCPRIPMFTSIQSSRATAGTNGSRHLSQIFTVRHQGDLFLVGSL